MTVSTIHGFRTVLPAKGKADSPATPAKPSTPAAAPANTGYLDQLINAGGGVPPADTPQDEGSALEAFLAQHQKASGSADIQGQLPQLHSFEEIVAQMPNVDIDNLHQKFSVTAMQLVARISNLKAGLAKGQGSPELAKQVQTLLKKCEEALSFCKLQLTKIEAYLPQQAALAKKQTQEVINNGGSYQDHPELLDPDGNGKIGDGTFGVGTRFHSKDGTNPITGKKYKAGETEKAIINSKTGKQVQFDPVTHQMINENVPQPNYVWQGSKGFSDSATFDGNTLNLTIGSALANKSNFADAGMQIVTPEFLWMKTDTKGKLLIPGQVYDLKVVNGELKQSTPPADGPYKQVYVKGMQVRSNSEMPKGHPKADKWDPKDGSDIQIQFIGGEGNDTLLTMNITGKTVNGKYRAATDVALAITSGDGATQRKTAIDINANAYVSTCKTGIEDPKHFYDGFDYKNNKATGKGAAQINDTLSNFMSPEKSVSPRGLSIKARGVITFGTGNNLMVVDDPPTAIKQGDPGYATVVYGGDGYNAVFAGKGDLYTTNMTLSVKKGDKKDIAQIGTRTFAYKKDASGYLSTDYTKSTKQYHDIVAGTVLLENEADSKSKDDKLDPTGYTAGDDYYRIQADNISVVHSDDPDMIGKGFTASKKPVGSGDFEEYQSTEDKIKANIDKPASAKEQDYDLLSGAPTWTQGKNYQADKNMLDQFFGDFSGQKEKTDPVSLEEKYEKIAGGGSDE